MDRANIIRGALFAVIFIFTAILYRNLSKEKSNKQQLMELLLVASLEYLIAFALGFVLNDLPGHIVGNSFTDSLAGTIITEGSESTEDNNESLAGDSQDNVSPEPIYINEMEYASKYGKLWTRSDEEKDYYTHSPDQYPECLSDTNTDGHTAGPVTDNRGNVYKYGLHLDAAESDDFYISFELNGVYTTFTGTCAFPGNLLSPVYSYKYEKHFVVYGDEKVLYVSPNMDENMDPQAFTIDVTDVQMLSIVYPNSHGPYEVATLFDGMLS